MTYLDGNLTIVLPGFRNDIGLRLLFMLITAVLRAWRINFLMIGGTTLRRPGRGRSLSIDDERSIMPSFPNPRPTARALWLGWLLVPAIALGISPATMVLNHLNQPRELVKAEPVHGLYG